MLTPKFRLHKHDGVDLRHPASGAVESLASGGKTEVVNPGRQVQKLRNIARGGHLVEARRSLRLTTGSAAVTKFAV